MLKTYTARYTKISSGYMGQLVEWPEVITEGETLEDCREFLQDALQEMIAAYRQQEKELPLGGAPSSNRCPLRYKMSVNHRELSLSPSKGTPGLTE